MTLVVLFVVFFLGGPLAFRWLTHRKNEQDNMRTLGAGASVCAIAGLVLRYGFSDIWGRNAGLTIVGVALIWFAWVGVLAYGARALREIDNRLPMRRWTEIIGAAGTTMPWFGLVSANFIHG